MKRADQEDGATPVGHAIIQKLAAQQRRLSSFYSQTSCHQIFYSRKAGCFLQVLDFEPRVLDGKGRRRPPSEFKGLTFGEEALAKLALGCRNSSLFHWFITVFSDCRHLNKRKVDALPINLETLSRGDGKRELQALAVGLMDDWKKHSVNRTMTFQHDTLTVQCSFPKTSKPIADKIDRGLGRHCGFTPAEWDFLINYDIQYRLGRDTEEE